MKQLKLILILLPAFIALVIFSGCFYTVQETQQVIITQFGKPVGDPITKAGLHWKTPFIQKVNVLEKRVLQWDGPSNEMPTKDKTYIEVDTFARWMIADPTQFFVRIRDIRSAHSRLDDIIGSEVRTAVASHELIEIIRSDKTRVPVKDETLQQGSNDRIGGLPSIQKGRIDIEKEVKRLSAGKLRELGIELIDVRFKRINYNKQVLASIYNRMISERQQIAQGFRSEGEGQAAVIMGRKERELKKIASDAYKKVQEIQGAADAEATRIYAESFNKSTEASDFYAFIKTLETYKTVLSGNSIMVLSTDSDLFRLLKRSKPEPAK